MNRQQMIQILSTMDDAHLARALGATGIEAGGDPGEGDVAGDSGLTSWNATTIDMPQSDKPRRLFDTTRFVVQDQQPVTRRMQQAGIGGASPQPGLESYMPQGALGEG